MTNPQLTEIGKCRPKGQPTDNLFQFSKCDTCGDNPACADEVVIENAANITGIEVVDCYGDTHTLMFSSTKTGANDVREAVASAVLPYAIDPRVRTAASGATDFKLTYIGAARITKVFRQSSADLIPTKVCTQNSVCDYKATEVDAIEIDGTPLANSPYAWSSNPTTRQTTMDVLKSDVLTAIPTALGVKVSAVVQSQKYQIVVRHKRATWGDHLINGGLFTQCNCKSEFIA